MRCYYLSLIVVVVAFGVSAELRNESGTSGRSRTRVTR